MDPFRTDLKPVLFLEGLLDPPQDATLPELHHRDVSHKSDAEITHPWAIRVNRSDRAATPRADVLVEIVPGDLDVLWWWESSMVRDSIPIEFPR